MYTPIYNSIFQEQGFLNRTLDAIENVFSGIKDPKKFEGCLALHCFTSVMNVLLHNANKNSQDKEHAIKHIFRDEVLTHVLRLSSRAVSNQSTDYLFNEIEETLKQQGAYVNISDLAMLQLHNKPH